MALLAFGTTAASADDLYFQPRMDVQVSVNSNRDLVSSGPTTASEGYYANFGGTLNYLTPDSTVIFRPQVGYEDYPRVGEKDSLAIADLYSDHRTERSDFLVTGQFDRRSTYGSELADATFNTVNPLQPTAPDTGRINVNDTRTLGTLSPNYTYDLTKRLSWALGGVFQDADYSGPGSNGYVPFTYYVESTALGWAATPRLDAKITAFGTQESAKNGTGSVNGGGVTLGFDYKWSTQFTTHVEILGERDNADTRIPTPVSETSTSGGATVVTTWKGEISSLMFVAGRTFTPSGAGGKYSLDQVHVEYNRDLAPRWKLIAAGIYDRYTPVASAIPASEYTYVNVEVSVKWLWTPTWYVSTGAQYLFNKLGPPLGSASNDMLYVQFGYLGLSR
ncbi:MAG TPA: hypothetical protein VIY90_03095 [Steroidobacteraceae bacterium]